MQTHLATSLDLDPSADDAGRAVGFFALARSLYDRISGGHDGLGFHVRGVPSVTRIEADGKRRPVLLGYGQGEADDTGREWRPARDLVTVDGDRRLVPRVLTPQAIAAHVRGGYAVAVEAAGWVEWVAIDIDAHAVEADGADGAGQARRRARRVLGQVLGALGCGGERWPVILRSPGGGFHVWIPLSRGVGADHRWPASWAAAWFKHHLAACGVELAPGVCEVYPSGGRLRAPCGRGSVLLRVAGELANLEGDPYALVPWPGTASTRARWATHGDVLTVRQVRPMLAAFVGEWERQRRTIADWTGRPEAGWDPCWGFLARRGGAEKIGPEVPGGYSRSQQVDDVSDPPPGRGPVPASGRPALVVIAGGGAGGDRGSLLGLPASFSKTADGAELPRDVGEVEAASVPSMLVKGPAFWRKVHRLIAEGVTAAGTRHDAVLTLSFAWGAAAGLSDGETLDRLVAWCGAHAHAGSRLAGSPQFTRECVREAAHYLAKHGPRWPFRGRGRASAVSMGVLVAADQRVLELVDPRVRTEASAVLAFLAGKADDGGTVADPVEWATGLVRRLLGDRRVEVEGARRRAAVLAVEELARLGVITRHSGHAVGRRGRRWSVWYRFGSGVVPAAVTVDRASWERAGRREVLAPSLAMPAATVAPVIVEAAQDAPGAAEAAAVEVREVAARPVREGVLRALSAAGAPVRLVLVPGPDAPGPARPGYRAAWWLRQWRGAPPVGAFLRAHEGAIVVGPRLVAGVGVARLASNRARAQLHDGRDSADRGAAAPAPMHASGSAAPAAVHDGRDSADRGLGPAGGSYDPPRAELPRALLEPGGAVELYAGPRAVAPELGALPAELAAELGAIAPDLAGALGKGWADWARRARERGDGESS
jgi:hypothetical protein